MARKTKKKSTSRKSTPASGGALPDDVPVLEQGTWFEADTLASPADRNDALADLLSGAWNPLHIVSIRRIEIGSTHGWEATYRA